MATAETSSLLIPAVAAASARTEHCDERDRAELPHRKTVGDLKTRCVRAVHGSLGHVFKHVGADRIRGDVFDVELLAVTRSRCVLVDVCVLVDRCDGVRFWAVRSGRRNTSRTSREP